MPEKHTAEAGSPEEAVSRCLLSVLCIYSYIGFGAPAGLYLLDHICIVRLSPPSRASGSCASGVFDDWNEITMHIQ